MAIAKSDETARRIRRTLADPTNLDLAGAVAVQLVQADDVEISFEALVDLFGVQPQEMLVALELLGARGLYEVASGLGLNPRMIHNRAFEFVSRYARIPFA